MFALSDHSLPGQECNPPNFGSEEKLAEREGFEPPVALRLHVLSKHAHSTTLPSLRRSVGHSCERFPMDEGPKNVRPLPRSTVNPTPIKRVVASEEPHRRFGPVPRGIRDMITPTVKSLPVGVFHVV